MNEVSDFQLIEDARRGNRAAFDRLVERYQRPLHAHLLGHGIRGQDCDDVAQDIWLKVWKEIHVPRDAGGYDPERAGFYTWVIKCFAHYRVLDWYESRDYVPGTGETTEDQDREFHAEPAAEFDPSLEERLRLQTAASTVLFGLLWRCGGYPHEQIAFTFAKLIYGGESERGTEGVPQRVDQEHGHEWLDVAIDRCWAIYACVSGIDDSLVRDSLHRSMEPARIRLTFTVGELIRPLPEHLRSLTSEKTARTCLRNYYAREQKADENERTHPISYWCWRVLHRIRHLLDLPADVEMDAALGPLAQNADGGSVEERDCSRCKLRHVRPCQPGRGDDSERNAVGHPCHI